MLPNGPYRSRVPSNRIDSIERGRQNAQRVLSQHAPVTEASNYVQQLQHLAAAPTSRMMQPVV